jgi:hypothetical protein
VARLFTIVKNCERRSQNCEKLWTPFTIVNGDCERGLWTNAPPPLKLRSKFYFSMSLSLKRNDKLQFLPALFFFLDFSDALQEKIKLWLPRNRFSASGEVRSRDVNHHSQIFFTTTFRMQGWRDFQHNHLSNGWVVFFSTSTFWMVGSGRQIRIANSLYCEKKRKRSEFASLRFASQKIKECSLSLRFAFWTSEFAELRKNSQNPRKKFTCFSS